MNRFKKNSYLYDWISRINDNIYFGPIPNEYLYEQLCENSFTLIINLTENEINNSIKTIHFPIIDNSTPENNLQYSSFIYQLKKYFENGEKIYIHCRGGHSRSSMVTVSLLCCIYDKEFKDIINDVIECHKSRVVLRSIWRYRSPFNYKQFTFLYHIHKNIYINLDQNNIYNWLSPKNIWITKLNTLDDYVNNKLIDKNYLFNMIKHNSFFLHKIKNTFLKKFIFSEKGDFYNKLFCFFRENLD